MHVIDSKMLENLQAFKTLIKKGEVIAVKFGKDSDQIAATLREQLFEDKSADVGGPCMVPIAEGYNVIIPTRKAAKACARKSKQGAVRWFADASKALKGTDIGICKDGEPA
ncbi:hypothetical protein Trydic_g13750 [Trypoxylus dichotomus]